MTLWKLLYFLPLHWLSAVTGVLSGLHLPFRAHSQIKSWFIRAYDIDVSEAEKPVEEYATLAEFFIRKLKADARPLADSLLISPVDGRMVQKGLLSGINPRLTQVKGRDYSLQQLLGCQWDVSRFSGGKYGVIYLAPHNYHRIHAPIDGLVTKVVHVPGTLWPVNTWGVRNIDGLFVSNDRVIVELQAESGTLILVLVGAANVGKIKLEFTDIISGNRMFRNIIQTWTPENVIPVKKGDPVGYFALGSTVVMICDSQLLELIKKPAGLYSARDTGGNSLRMGQEMMI